jgi:hypothetical protein
MKKLLLIAILPLAACANSKETYTETRTLRYPKGQTPHLKDFYLQPEVEQPQPQPQYSGVHDSDVLPWENNHQSELDRLNQENALLIARQYNQALRNQ